MDTSGKGGIVRHVVGAVDPQGIDHFAFKAPTAEPNSGTTSSGASASGFPSRAGSASSTARTMRTS